MADPPPAQTPEDVLEAEIEDLERNTLKSGPIWGIALVGLVLLGGAAFLITRWDNRQQANRVPVFTPEPIRVIEPWGDVDDAPVFRWDAVDNATSYIVMVRAAERDENVLLRPVRETFLRPTEMESADFTSGPYTWSVEARSSSGALIGYGEGTFSIRSLGS